VGDNLKIGEATATVSEVGETYVTIHVEGNDPYGYGNKHESAFDPATLDKIATIVEPTALDVFNEAPIGTVFDYKTNDGARSYRLFKTDDSNVYVPEEDAHDTVRWLGNQSADQLTVRG
jgi:hypothetical protein